MIRPSDYFLTPRDYWALIRAWGPRDWRGIGLSAILGLAVGLRLADLSAGLFVAGLVGALYWRLDSRWPLGGALVLLVLIPITQFLYDHNLAIMADGWGRGLAVAVWYLLAIGVVRQVVELRRLPHVAAETVPEIEAAAAAVARAPRSPAAPLPPTRRRTPLASPEGPVPARPGALGSTRRPLVMSKRQQRALAYRVLGRIEHMRRGVDGIYRRIKP